MLDGQQRLTALWKALKNKDEKYRYYIEYNNKYKIKNVEKFSKNINMHKELISREKAFEKSLFPVSFLDSSVTNAEIGKWIHEEPIQTDNTEVFELIESTRKKFLDNDNGYIIPYFKLDSDIETKEAIDIYQSINKNSVKLSPYFHAVADMEKEVGKSLYDIAKKITTKIPDWKEANLESDDTGELILKIFCVMKEKIPSAKSYKILANDELFAELIEKNDDILEGIKWAVDKLNKIKIWHGRQLPSTIPLRVLPALYEKYKDYIDRGKRNERANRTALADQLINRYLWHAFLTNRYARRAGVNELLLKDYIAIANCFDESLSDSSKNDIPIFSAIPIHKSEGLKKSGIPIFKNLGWPTTGGIIARGVLLACCQKGAIEPIQGTPIDKDSLKSREFHHIFPKDKLKNFNPDKIFNCLFISKDENKKFNNHLPGTYLKDVYKDQDPSSPFNKDFVKDNLETHCISSSLANSLIGVEDETHATPKEIKEAYDEFIKKRCEIVKKTNSKTFKRWKSI